MKIISGLKELEIPVHNFFVVCLVVNFGAIRAPRKNVHLVISLFSEIMNQIVYLPERNLIYFQNMPIYYPSRKFVLSNHSFLEYCYTILFVHYISCPYISCTIFRALYFTACKSYFKIFDSQ